jgi:sugar phosphate isomerase/epimerase
MKLGLSTYAYPWAIGIAGYPPAFPMDIYTFLNHANRLGVKVVQIADNLPLHQLTDTQLNNVRNQAMQKGIHIEVGTRGIQPEHLQSYLELARFFKSSILRVVVDTTDHHPAPEEIISTLRSLMPDFIDSGVTLAIENHDRFKVKTLVQIIKAIDSPRLGICLDTVNSFGAGEGPEVVVNALGPYVINLHVKDYVIKRHHHMLGFEVVGTPAGQGQLNIPWLIEALDRDSHYFNAILELWPPLEPDLESTIHKEDEWVETSIDYLRTLIAE